MVWNCGLLLLLLHTSRIWARAQFEEQKRIIQQIIDTLARLNSTGNNPQDVSQLSTLTNPLIAESINQHGLADIQVSDGKTPLMIAATRGHLEVVNYLIGKGADVNHLDENGWNSLMHASQNNHVVVARSLFRGGANPDLKTNNFGDTALIWAIRRGNILLVRELLVGGAELNLPNNFGETPLMTAALSNKAEAARLLLSAGADIDRQDERGKTPFIEAVDRGFPNVVRVFMEHCPNLQLFNQYTYRNFSFSGQTVQFFPFNLQIPEIAKMIEDHPNLQCSHDNRIYGVGQTRYDVCREVKCCQGVWSPTGQTLETCGNRCRKILAPAGVCTLIASCPMLQQEFLSTVQSSTNRSNSGREFVKNYGCGFVGGSDLRVCCPTA